MVSIIIPCYNSEKYILQTLKSIEKQSYKNIEIICVDDGSNDRTLELLNDYKRDCLFDLNIIHKENGGVSSARNCGIDNANGDYLFFLDSDDTIFPNTIQLLVRGYKDNNSDITYGSWTKDVAQETELVKGIDKRIKDVNDAYMYKRMNLVFASFLYKRSIIIDHNIRFDESLKYGEDNLFLWKYLCFVNKGTEYSTPVYYYNLHDESAVHNVSWRITDAIEATLKACEYFKDHNFKYLKAFKEYMPQRTMFYAAKEFAIYGKKDLFDRLVREYNVKKYMHSLYNKNGMALTLSAMLLGNMPKLFYGVMRTYGRKLNKTR